MKTSLLMLALVAVAAGCGRPFDVKTGKDFAELQDQKDEGFDYRAMTPEGVALSVRTLRNDENADLGFWVKAITLKLREEDGYALLGDEIVKSKNGTSGRRLRFAREEDKKTYDYRVTLYLAQSRIFLVESGGAREVFQKSLPIVEQMESSVAVQCKSWLTPVLASRTCNRW